MATGIKRCLSYVQFAIASKACALPDFFELSIEAVGGDPQSPQGSYDVDFKNGVVSNVTCLHSSEHTIIKLQPRIDVGVVLVV